MSFDRRRVLIALGGLTLAACSGIRGGPFEAPTVTLDSFRLLPSEGLSPRFLIGLRVINPNPVAIDLRGISYDVELEGQRLLTGVAGNLARVPPYAESEIELQAGVNLLGSIRLLNDLLTDASRDRLAYVFRARLDVAGLPQRLTLEETGELTLVGAGGR